MNVSLKRKDKKIPKKRHYLIHYIAINIDLMSPELIQLLKEVLKSICKDENDIKMMWEYLTTECSKQYIMDKYFCSKSKIEALYTKFVRATYKKIIERTV